MRFIGAEKVKQDSCASGPRDTPMLAIVRAAVAEVEIEDYSRVDLRVGEDLHVVGHAANDLAHLLAELIENAISFSPPGTRVQLSGQHAHSSHVIQVEDAGLGMSDEELAQANQRLADPPDIDFALSRMLGLYVVGRLAQRHGIKVKLAHSWYGGVTALVLVPRTLLERVDGSQPGAAGRAWSQLEVTRRAGLRSGKRGPDPGPVGRGAAGCRLLAVPGEGADGRRPARPGQAGATGRGWRHLPGPHVRDAELSYAVDRDLEVAAVGNLAGRFVVPSSTAAAAAARDLAELSAINDFR